MCNNETPTISDLYLITDSTKYPQSEFRKMDIEVENSWMSLRNGQWNSFHLTSWEKMAVLKSSILCTSRTSQQMAVHEFFSYTFLFWSFLNKTGMAYLFSKDGIAFISKKIQKYKLPEIICSFHKAFIHIKMKLYQKNLI